MEDGITRGKVTGSRVRGGKTLVTIQMFDGDTRDRVELLQPYGLTAVPMPGADVMVLEVGTPDHLVALMADDSGLRATALNPGELAIRDSRGQMVTFTPDGIRITGALKVAVVSAAEVEVQSGTTITLTAPVVGVTGDMNITGDVAITGSLTINGLNFSTHKHSGVQTGAGTTGNPTA